MKRLLTLLLLFPLATIAAPAPLATPLETAGYARISTSGEIDTYLKALAAREHRMHAGRTEVRGELLLLEKPQ